MTSFIFFSITLLLLVAFLVIKHKEIQKGAPLFGASYRSIFDTKIMRIESFLREHCTFVYGKHLLGTLYNIIAHKFAKITASIAKKVEWRARSVAHKSAKARKEGQETRENTFLTDVQSHKDTLDVQKVAEDAKL